MSATLTNNYDPECRECRAGLAQAQNATIRFWCSEHDYVELTPDYSLHSRILTGDVLATKDAEIASLREALQHEREECARLCFDVDLCAAPLHCGCREKIAKAIRERV